MKPYIEFKFAPSNLHPQNRSSDNAANIPRLTERDEVKISQRNLSGMFLNEITLFQIFVFSLSLQKLNLARGPRIPELTRLIQTHSQKTDRRIGFQFLNIKVLG